MTTPKFGHDARTEALYRMSLDGWFTASSGDVEAPTGWFAWTEIRESELAEIGDAFDAEFGDIVDGSDADVSALVASLVGGWLLTEDSQGFVDAIEYPLTNDATFGVSRTAPARVAFDALEAEYGEWSDAE